MPGLIDVSSAKYQHRTNQKQFSKIVGFADKRLLLFAPSPLSFLFFFFCYRLNFTDELARKRLLRRLKDFCSGVSVCVFEVCIGSLYISLCKGLDVICS